MAIAATCIASSLLIIDDKAGRQAAARGLRFVGLVGVLREARVRGFIPRLRPLLDSLRGAGYYLSDEPTRQVLETVGERYSGLPARGE